MTVAKAYKAPVLAHFSSLCNKPIAERICVFQRKQKQWKFPAIILVWRSVQIWANIWASLYLLNYKKPNAINLTFILFFFYCLFCFVRRSTQICIQKYKQIFKGSEILFRVGSHQIDRQFNHMNASSWRTNKAHWYTGYEFMGYTNKSRQHQIWGRGLVQLNYWGPLQCLSFCQHGSKVKNRDGTVGVWRDYAGLVDGRDAGACGDHEWLSLEQKNHPLLIPIFKC